MEKNTIRRGFVYVLDEAAKIVTPFAADKTERMKENLDRMNHGDFLRPGSLALQEQLR